MLQHPWSPRKIPRIFAHGRRRRVRAPGERTAQRIRLAVHRVRALRSYDSCVPKAEIPRIVAHLKKIGRSTGTARQNSGNVFPLLLLGFLRDYGRSMENGVGTVQADTLLELNLDFGLRHKCSRLTRERESKKVILKRGFPKNLSSSFHQQPP
jgi:hypothetical protein